MMKDVVQNLPSSIEVTIKREKENKGKVHKIT